MKTHLNNSWRVNFFPETATQLWLKKTQGTYELGSWQRGMSVLGTRSWELRKCACSYASPTDPILSTPAASVVKIYDIQRHSS